MDRRTKYTKKIIKDTLINLLSENDKNKITVSEICKIADINSMKLYKEITLLNKLCFKKYSN